MSNAHDQGGSAEYHAAHLAFARVGIVEAAAQQQPILELLRAYTSDVARAERDRYREVIERECIDAETERDRYREALEHIAESAEHPSPTVNTAAYLGHTARKALG